MGTYGVLILKTLKENSFSYYHFVALRFLGMGPCDLADRLYLISEIETGRICVVSCGYILNFTEIIILE